jgi:hypothetical protein
MAGVGRWRGEIKHAKPIVAGIEDFMLIAQFR